MQEEMTASRSGRKGLALIVVVGVLGVMALLATAFVTMAQLERRASQQRLNATKALLLANSGVEDVLARLDMGQDPQLSASRYGGEDWDNDGSVTGLESASEAYRIGIPNLGDCPASSAMRPSFFRKSATDLDFYGLPAPARLSVDGRDRGYSGRLAGGQATDTTLTYSLNVEEESGKINVNGGFLDGTDRDDGGGNPDCRDTDVTSTAPAWCSSEAATGRGWNKQLTRILNVLGSQPEVGIPTLGTDVIQNRPEGGYASITALQAAISTTTDLSPWLTVSSWVDRGVIHPNAYVDSDFDPDLGITTGLQSNPRARLNKAKSISQMKRARVPLALEEEGRPPVDLNAAPRPVLVALMSGLSGQSWATVPWAGGMFVTISPTLASGIATALDDFRNGRDPSGIFASAGLTTPGPFSTWTDFGAFCDALVPTVISGMNTGVQYNSPPGAKWTAGGGNLAVADLLKANFNPNTQSNKECPDALSFRWVDKTDLTVWSTEGSLYSSGTTRVSVAARVRDPNGRLLASASFSCTVQPYTLTRQSSQRDFIAGRNPEDCFSRADAGQRTFGANSSWLPVVAPAQGLGAVSYPCHPLALPYQGKPAGPDFDNSCALDGHIALASVELDETQAPFVVPPGGPLASSYTFVQHFDGPANPVTPGILSGWDASLGASRARATAIDGADVDIDLDTATTNASVRPVWTSDGKRPSTLYPDGVHQQPLCWPAYLAGSNLPPAAGTTNRLAMSFWLRPCNPNPFYVTLTTLEATSVIGIVNDPSPGVACYFWIGPGRSFVFGSGPEQWNLAMWNGRPRLPGMVFPPTYRVKGFDPSPETQIPIPELLT